jgi:hypothetical protein
MADFPLRIALRELLDAEAEHRTMTVTRRPAAFAHARLMAARWKAAQALKEATENAGE